MYNLLFYHLYYLSEFIKKTFKSIYFTNVSVVAVIIMSVLLQFNFITIYLWLDIPAITTNSNLDLVLIGAINLGFNGFYFLYNSRYKKIIDKYLKSDSTLKSYSRLLIYFYIPLTIYLFIRVKQ